MFEFKYRNKQAVLVTTDELQHLHEQRFWRVQIAEWQRLETKYIFVVTSLSKVSLPNPLRRILKQQKHCYVGHVGRLDE